MKTKRILAIAGIIILVGLYITTLLLAIFGNENTNSWFMASIAATIVLPVLIWVYMWIYNRLRSDMTAAGKQTSDSSASSADNSSDDN